MKRSKLFTLAVALLCCAALLVGCGGKDAGETQPTPTENSTEAAYRVSVVDALGNPYGSGVIVRFMQNGQQVSMQVADANGVAEKVLTKGDYTLELAFTDTKAAYHYDLSGITLTKDQTEATVTMAMLPGEAVELGAQGKTHNAYPVGVGCTYVTLTAGERNYFLFTPTEAGKYQFSVAAGEAAIGYYGNHHFVQAQSAVEVANNSFFLNVKSDMLGENSSTILVVGLDAAAGTENATLAIQRVGDPDWSVEDEPWQTYISQTPVKPYTLDAAAGGKLTYVDVTKPTDTYPLVYNEADGFYHIGAADGPVMLVHLAKGITGNAPYISFEEMLGDGTPDTGYTALRKYFYDDNGNFVKKEEYTECMVSYIVNSDETYGVYPLTKDLEYMIRNGGDQQGWWKEDSHGYLFGGNVGTALVGVNEEISWMFACCYFE